ncbi:hypothetical protein DL764_001342 [Monosporascus ibericus]|uniref:GST C-terminal domain-containing protein n=1 Tax=Monosporascus ibericus TaxID=155417 RepID=A0A4Q4TPU2_9PEZI|nr:hypothetical protein DL764_001342 [Monosporascus ibericus]
MTKLELFVLTWAMYPRRVLIYLHEKGLIESPHLKITPVTISAAGKMEAPGKPPGTLPILKLPNGSFIKESAAILDYFEDICDNPQDDWHRELAGLSRKNMTGSTAEERAHMRAVRALADQASSLFGFAARKGSKFFAPFETLSAEGSRLAIEYCKRDLKLLEAYYEGDKRLENGEADAATTIADCALFSLLQFSKAMHAVDLLTEPELPNLKRFYENFKERESGKIEEGLYPEDVRQLTSHWLY